MNLEAVLIDNSAFARLDRADLAAARRDEVADAIVVGDVVTSLPFLLEAGYSARDGASHDDLLEALSALPQVSIDGETERLALAAQRALARAGHHRLPPVDLITAALAHQHSLGVLHYDADFDLIRAKTELRFESIWLAERGSLR